MWPLVRPVSELHGRIILMRGVAVGRESKVSGLLRAYIDGDYYLSSHLATLRLIRTSSQWLGRVINGTVTRCQRRVGSIGSVEKLRVAGYGSWQEGIQEVIAGVVCSLITRIAKYQAFQALFETLLTVGAGEVHGSKNGCEDGARGYS